MDISTIGGLILGFGALALSVSLEGGSLGALWSQSAFVIVIGGTFGAALISFPKEYIIGLPKLIGQAFKEPKGAMSPVQVVSFFVELANKARRDGLLSLEEEGAKVKDDFMRKGIQLIVDGVDPKLVRDILETDAGADGAAPPWRLLSAGGDGRVRPHHGHHRNRHGTGKRAGQPEPSPVSLARPSPWPSLPLSMVLRTANLLWLPLGSKLKRKSESEVYLRELMTEGILSVQAGDNPAL